MSLRNWGVVVCTAAAIGVSGILGSGIVGSAVPGVAQGAPAAPATVVTRYVDTERIGTGVPIPVFGGISGIDAIGRGQYALISTDVGRFGPARFFTASIPVDTQADVAGPPGFTGGGTVLGPGNIPVLPGGAQFEGLRKYGGGYVTVSGGAHPFVREIGPFGTFVRDFRLPNEFRRLAGQRGLTGVAVGPQRQVSVITAGGLAGDNPTAARLVVYAGRSTAQFTYRTDPGFAAADVLAVNATDYVVLERGRGRATRIYWATTRGADRVGGRATVGAAKAMTKQRVFDTAPIPRLDIGNASGMAWGPWLPDFPWLKYRGRSLLVVTNDGFSNSTRVHALEIRFPKRP